MENSHVAVEVEEIEYPDKWEELMSQYDPELPLTPEQINKNYDDTLWVIEEVLSKLEADFAALGGFSQMYGIPKIGGIDDVLLHDRYFALKDMVLEMRDGLGRERHSWEEETSRKLNRREAA